MVKDRRSRLLAVLMLGLMALLVTPRDLLHQCDAHVHDELAAGLTLHADEDCAICQAVVGAVLPAPPQGTVMAVGGDAPEPSLALEPVIGPHEEFRVPRGPPARC